MFTTWESRIGAVVYGTHGDADQRLTEMSVEIRDDVTALSDFVACAVVPSEARGARRDRVQGHDWCDAGRRRRACRPHRAIARDGGRHRRVPRPRNVAPDEPRIRGVRQRRGRACARLRRHVLRVARSPELRAGPRPPRCGRARAVAGPRAARCLRRRLRARVPARPRDESASLPSARLALHLVDRHARRGRGGGAGARPRRARDATRAGHCGVGGRRAEGEPGQHGQAAARGHGRAQWRDGGPARAARLHRQPARDRRAAGLSHGDGQRAVRRSRPRLPISARVGRSWRPVSR